MLKSKFLKLFSSLPILFETNAVQIPLFGEFFALFYPDFRALCHCALQLFYFLIKSKKKNRTPIFLKKLHEDKYAPIYEC